MTRLAWMFTWMSVRVRELPTTVRWLLKWQRRDIAAWGRLSKEQREIAYLFELRPTRVEERRFRMLVEDAA